MRAAAGAHEARNLRVVRFGDNMREVADTDGDKVEVQARLGTSCNTYPVNELVKVVDQMADADVDRLCAEYDELYDVVPDLRPDGERRESLRDAARIELGLRAFLRDLGSMAFVDTFEDLGGLKQLPGIAAQRLMADGYGFGAEGDWKSSAMVRIVKAMSEGLPGGVSFMEDYTYDFGAASPAILGAHMLEICPTIAAAKPSCEIHPLFVGEREDPVRLVFTGAAGPGCRGGPGRHGHASAPGGQRDRCHRPAGGLPAAARGTCPVGAQARLHHVGSSPGCSPVARITRRIRRRSAST